MRVDLELDTTGLMCPVPLLRLKKALLALEGGQILRVVATDPASEIDFRVFLEQAGHEMVNQTKEEETGIFCYLIRKG